MELRVDLMESAASGIHSSSLQSAAIFSQLFFTPFFYGEMLAPEELQSQRKTKMLTKIKLKGRIFFSGDFFFLLPYRYDKVHLTRRHCGDCFYTGHPHFR